MILEENGRVPTPAMTIRLPGRLPFILPQNTAHSAYKWAEKRQDVPLMRALWARVGNR